MIVIDAAWARVCESRPHGDPVFGSFMKSGLNHITHTRERLPHEMFACGEQGIVVRVYVGVPHAKW